MTASLRLALDSSAPGLSLALGDKNSVLAEKNFPPSKELAETIIPRLDAFLKSAKKKLEDVDEFLIGLGPGAFTGLRIGLATVKGLRDVSGKPVTGICSLDAIADAASGKDGRICVITDARRKMVYGARYERTRGRLKRIGAPVLTPVRDAVADLPEKTLVTGDALALYKDDVLEICPSAKLSPKNRWRAKASHLLTLSYQKGTEVIRDKNGVMTPIYLYPADCQVRR